MPALAETQAAFRHAIASPEPATITAGLRAPVPVTERLDIYRRHYRESFRRHLRGRYPTLEWLVGTATMVELADATLASQPPRAPSLAEYGAELIATVEARKELPAYLADVGRLDWDLGRLSVAVELPALDMASLAAVDPGLLGDVRLGLQPGLTYMHSAWPVDTLVHLHLSGAAPERLDFRAEAVWLELRGARGRFSLQRLQPASHAFRSALAAGQSLGSAAEAALAVAPHFDISAALAAIFTERCVTSFQTGETT